MAISELQQRRWHNFKTNRKSYISLWIFGILFFTTLFAEFIANDKPLLVIYKSQIYAPVFFQYSETKFGGDFETEADYRDPYVQELILEKGNMIWPPIRYSYNTINLDLKSSAPSKPDKENWLGTDDQGRDVLARIIYGFRLSVLFGLILTLCSSVIGIFFRSNTRVFWWLGRFIISTFYRNME